MFAALKENYLRGQKKIQQQVKNKNADFGVTASLDTIALQSGNIQAADYFRFQAFTTAAVHEQRIRTRIKAALVGNIKRGETQKDFLAIIDKTWKDAQLDNPRHLQTIYQTNTAMAFAEGQRAALLAHQDTFTHWQYVATLDGRTRPEHAALDGKIFKVTDHRFYPPIGFNCRCTAIPMTKEEVDELPAKDKVDTDAQASNLERLIDNKTFVGHNRQSKFIKWVENKYKQAERPTKLLIQKAVERLKADVEKHAIKIIRKKVKTFYSRFITDEQNGIIQQQSNLVTGKINLRRGDYKEVIGHKPAPDIFDYLLIMHKEISNWEYIGHSDKTGKHHNWYYVLIYQFRYKGVTYYANVGWDKQYGERIYTIQQTNSSKMIKGKPKNWRGLLQKIKG